MVYIWYEQTEVADGGRSGSNFARKAPAIRGPTVFWLVRSRCTCSSASMLGKSVLVLVVVLLLVATVTRAMAASGHADDSDGCCDDSADVL